MATKRNPRNKPTRPKDLDNPLQRFLGVFMRLERLRQRRSAPELAASMHLSPTFVKMLESGAVPLNIAMADTFIREMIARGDEATSDPRDIYFHRLTRYLSGSHWLAAQLAAGEGKRSGKDVILKATEALKEHDPEFERMYDLVHMYLDLKQESEKKEFLENVAAKEVSDFLRSDRYGAPSPDAGAIERLLKEFTGYYALASEGDRQAFIIQIAEPALERYLQNELIRKVSPVEVSERLLSLRDFLSMPSMNVDLLLDLKEALIDRPFVHTADLAASWEIKNWSKFRYARGLYNRPEVILNQPNLDQFLYWYLSNPRFEKVQFIFINQSDTGLGTSENELTLKFVEMLNIGRSKNPLVGPLTPSEIQKIKIICLNTDERQDNRVAQLLQGIDSENHPVEAYWCFETHRDVNIGFAGIEGDNMDNIRNLRLRESISRGLLFKQLWDDVEPKRTR